MRGWSPLPPAIRHKDIHHEDPERIRALGIVTRIATPQQKKILFSDLPGNDHNIKAIAENPFKSALVEKILDPFYKNFSVGTQEYREKEWAKRSIKMILTWFADITYGLFVMQSQDIPTTLCDSARIITQTSQGELFVSNNNKFSNVFRFQDPETKIGLAASLGEQQTLCGRRVNTLHRTDVFILIADTVSQFLKIPTAGSEFLDPMMQTHSKITSLTATSTLNIVGLHEAMDVRACELHKKTMENSLSLITHDMQEVTDSDGTPLLTFTNGEAIYAVECLKEEVIARSTEGICCNQLPIYTKDKTTNDFSVEMFMAPFTRRVQQFCSPIPCTPAYPSYYNVSSQTELAYYRVTNGIPHLTKDAPSPLSPTGLNDSYLHTNQEEGILSKEQEDGLTTRIHTGQAREAVISTASLGVVASFNSWLAPIIHPIKQKVPPAFMNAFDTVFSDGPLPGLLGKLPYYLQIALAIITLVMVLWGASHLAFLGIGFLKTATVNIKDAFHTNLAPTLGIKRALNFTTEQTKINKAQSTSIQQTSDTVQQIQIQNNFFKNYVTDTLEQQQSDIDYLKNNCRCRQRHDQCN